MLVIKKSEREFTGTEYVFTISGSDQRMIGCIKRYTDDTSEYPFHWEVEHDSFLPSCNAPTRTTIPSSRSGRSLDEAYESMTAYLNSMSLPLEKEE